MERRTATQPQVGPIRVCCRRRIRLHTVASVWTLTMLLAGSPVFPAALGVGAVAGGVFPWLALPARPPRPSIPVFGGYRDPLVILAPASGPCGPREERRCGIAAKQNGYTLQHTTLSHCHSVQDDSCLGHAKSLEAKIEHDAVQKTPTTIDPDDDFAEVDLINNLGMIAKTSTTNFFRGDTDTLGKTHRHSVQDDSCIDDAASPEARIEHDAVQKTLPADRINNLGMFVQPSAKQIFHGIRIHLGKARCHSVQEDSCLGVAKSLETKTEHGAAQKTLTITDSGVDLSEADLTNNLGMLAKTSTTHFFDGDTDAIDVD